MKRFAQIALFTLMLISMPLKQWAQQPYRQYAEDGILLNLNEIDNFYFRVYLLYNLNEDNRFDLIANVEPGQFSVTWGEGVISSNLYDAFETYYNDAYTDFSFLSKTDLDELMPHWKNCIPSTYFASMMTDIALRSGRPVNNHCVDSDPFCTSDVISFDAATTSQTADQLEGATFDDGCIGSSYNPSWYHMRIQTGGQFIIHMEGHDPSNGTTRDIDFCIWGPFTNPTSPCVAQLTSDKIIDCCYSASYSEDIYLGYAEGNHVHNTGHGTVNYHLPEVGEYYILMITNFSQQPCTITFTKTAGSGPGETDCGILPGVVTNDGPYCVGETIHLTVNAQDGATYSWTGPGGFSSTVQNPTRPNCTLAMAGTYTCTTTVGSQHTTASTEVVIYPMPTANFNFTTVCVGNATQFTSTSTTNPAGQPINSYQWNFGDGQTGTGQNVSHTYAQAGTYQVTLTVSCGGHCTSTKTQTVTVNAQPTANFTYTTVCQGNATQFTSTSTGQGITSYQWNFGDGQTGSGQNVTHTYAQAGTYQVTLTVGTAGGACSDVITQPVTVNSQPTSNFTYTSVCRGNPTQFTSTATGQGITSYQWNFGDGQTGTGQNVTHTYAQAGDYQVTLTVSTDGHCSDQKTQTVPVYASPVASATAQPNTVMYGATSTLTANAGATGTFNFHWEPANMVVNPNNQTTATVPLQATQTYTVTVTNPQGGCSSSAQVTVSIDGSSMSAMATADQTSLCIGESTTLHALPSGGTGNYTFSWTPANTLNNANIQDPVATPPLGSTTYTCHVSDGFTDINVSVTVVVHPNVEADIYQTICENDHFDFFGESLQTPGVYDHTLQTQFGCDSVVHLHLANWDIYETPVSDRFCENETYSFYDQTISEPGVYYHTLESVHGCDSVIRINLTTNPVYEYELFESTCEGGPGYYFNGDYLHPRPEPYYYNFETTLGCDSLIILHVGEAEYNSKSYNVSICAEEYTWASNGITFYESGVYYDTIHYEESCDSTLILNLELRPSHQTDIVMTSCDDYHWQNDEYHVDMTFSESTVYTQHYINTFGCESEATLYLTINDHDEYEFTVGDDENCDEYFWDSGGHEIVYTDHEGSVYNMSGIYHRTYKNQADCDSLVTMNVQFEYTPHPTPIYPMDANNGAPHWVVTATEFQINSYDFNLWDENPNCRWDTVIWSCDEAPEWVLEPFGPRAKCCKVYVLNHLDDTVWLKAHAFNRCAPNDGVEQRYWLIPSFYGVDENEPQCELCNFDVLPNPNTRQMTLNFEYLTGKVDVRVYDMRGTLIDQFTTFNGNGPSQYTYNMRTKSDGIYFFVATSKEGTVAKKVVIQK